MIGIGQESVIGFAQERVIDFVRNPHIFRKSSVFAYQSEVRIALKPGTGAAYRFDVGDLADITLTGLLTDLNRLIKID